MTTRVRNPSLYDEEGALLDLLLLCVVVIANFIALRWCARQLVVDSRWLRDPEEREDILREFAVENIRELWNPSQRDKLSANPLFRLFSWLTLIGVIIWADRLAIHQLLPAIIGG